MPKIDFGGTKENVVTSDEFTMKQARQILEKETIVVLGYGVQGPAQALNLKDNGFEVIIGQMEGDEYWEKAISDGFVPGETLFPLEEAA
ncbi:MAG: ketol-acid reductoisomerase, partial [Desulfosudaceae bacterium]